jgi:curved DNA-binding protein CbpA
MNLQPCFELFKIGPDATLDEVNRAHRDLASIWHMNRFEKNPRLKRKVETQLKEMFSFLSADR